MLQLDTDAVLRDFGKAKKRLLVLGYNATLTTAVEAPRQPKRHFDQIQVMAPLGFRMHLLGCIAVGCAVCGMYRLHSFDYFLSVRGGS